MSRQRLPRKRQRNQRQIWRERLSIWRAMLTDRREITRFVWRASVLSLIWGGFLVFAVLAWYAYDLPDVRAIEGPTRRPSIIVQAVDGTQFARYGDLYGDQVTLKQLPKNMVNAVVAVEDRRFYDHPGIDLWGLARATYANLRAGHVVQGGSTITQQLAKNIFLTPERTFRRKVQEVLIALWLEHKYSKAQILTAYLNRVYLGAGAYGVDAAARTYFDKPVRQVNLREAAMIAGLLKAPSRYSPTNDPEQAAARAEVVLSTMVDAGFITEAEKKSAMAASSATNKKLAVDGRYFSAWIAEMASGLAGQTGQDLVVRTTLDLGLQQIAEKHVDRILDETGDKKDVDQAALVTLAPDGAVRAYVGGYDYDQSEFDRVTQAKRQPGSSFKTFVYLAAIEAGLTPDTLLDDAPLRIGGYAPANYDGKYRGTITARQALAESVNTVAVRVMQQVGPERVARLARMLGVTSRLNRDLSLALGTSETSLMDMATAYAGIAAGGRAVVPYAITEIRSRKGDILYQRPVVRTPVVVNPRAVAVLTDMLTSVVQSGTGTRAAIDRPAAGKTGTSQDYRDAWFIGFTADYTTAIWFGNDNNKPMRKITGGTLPARLWHDVMLEAEAGKPVQTLPSLYEASPDWSRSGVASAASPARTAEKSDPISDFISQLIGMGQ